MDNYQCLKKYIGNLKKMEAEAPTIYVEFKEGDDTTH